MEERRTRHIVKNFIVKTGRSPDPEYLTGQVVSNNGERQEEIPRNFILTAAGRYKRSYS